MGTIIRARSSGRRRIFCHKDRIFGILSPPLILTLASLVMMSSYSHKEVNDFSAQFLRIILTWHRGLLLLLLVFALFSRNAGLSIAAAASMSLTVATAYVGYHINYTRWSGPRYGILNCRISVQRNFAVLCAGGVAGSRNDAPKDGCSGAFLYVYPPPPDK